MRGNGKNGGFTLLEVLTVIIILGMLFAVAGPEVYKAIQSDATIKAAAKNLISDLKTAQSEAVSAGSGEMTGGILVVKSVFVAFTPGSSAYQLYSFADANGNNKRDDDGVEVGSVYAAKTLPAAVKFGAGASVTATACGSVAGTPPADGFSVAAFDDVLPCDNGAQCIEFNGNGFPVGDGPWNIYLTTNNSDNKNNYAVAINPAGNFTLCKWTKGDTVWTIVR